VKLPPRIQESIKVLAPQREHGASEDVHTEKDVFQLDAPVIVIELRLRCYHFRTCSLEMRMEHVVGDAILHLVMTDEIDDLHVFRFDAGSPLDALAHPIDELLKDVARILLQRTLADGSVDPELACLEKGERAWYNVDATLDGHAGYVSSFILFVIDAHELPKAVGMCSHFFAKDTGSLNFRIRVAHRLNLRRCDPGACSHHGEKRELHFVPLSQEK
jgi:hypothetical protein